MLGLVRVLLATLAMTGIATAAEVQPTLTGDTKIHDPSVIQLDDGFVALQTGQEGGLQQGAIRLKTSPDGLAWKDAGTIGKGLPPWVRPTLGYKPPNIWAPSVSKHGDIWYLYYSVSAFGINTSAIGLMTNAALTSAAPGEGWQDQGVVLTSNARDKFNAIDPWRIDTADGRAFLSYGSFWDGIKLRELDPQTGLLLAPDTPAYDLASRNGAGIEASSILEHDGEFFLFVSFDQCCKGVSSTYNIRVGRADAVTGPYVDAAGVPMLDGGGTLLQQSSGRFIGPGGQEAFLTSAGPQLAYHYYDGDDFGTPKLEIAPISWTPDGWPALAAVPD